MQPEIENLKKTIMMVLENQISFLAMPEREKLTEALTNKIIGKFYFISYNKGEKIE